MIVCFDLETTGLDKYNDKIIEIAMIKFDENTFEIIDTYSSFVDPEREIPDIISNITNIFDSDINGAPKITDLREEILNFIGDSVLLGHNVNFDIDFFINNGIDVSKNAKIDTFFLANFLNFTQSSLNLEMLCSYYNIEFTGAHRAINDVKATVELFRAQLKDFSKLKKDKKRIVYYLFSLSSDTNVKILQNLIFTDFGEKIDLESFEKILLKNISKTEYVDEFISDENLECEDIVKFFDFPNKVEQRINQLNMTKQVFSGFNNGKKMLIEAPTGLGKSFAYLIPSIIYSIKNNKKVYISTKTKTLQDQLFLKDLDFLTKNLNIRFTYTKLKGRKNYISLKGFFDYIFIGNLMYSEVSFLIKISFWLLETRYGELDELTFYPDEYSYLRDLNSDGFSSLQEKNNYKDYEFLLKSRKSVEKANIVIINHSLLFTDLVAESKLLPDLNTLVIDEAHNIEDSITESLRESYNLKQLKEHFDKCEKIFNFKNIKKIDFLKTKETLLSNLEIIDDYAFSYLNKKIPNDNQYKNLLVLDDFFSDIDFTQILVKINLDLLDIVDKLKVINEYDFTKEIVFFDSIAKNIIDFFDKNNSKYFIKMISFIDRFGISFDYTLLNPGEYLNKNLWEKLDSCLLTSATLSIGNSFDYIKNIIKLDNFDFYTFESDFDYKKQATLFIPIDIGSVKNNGDDIVMFLKEFYLLVRGKVLTLLTSFSVIRKIYTSCNIDLKKQGINLYAQSIGGSKNKILANFTKSPDNSILLGTDSFWEGVDIPGDDLKYLVIHKFPFIVPNDPIFIARSSFFKDSFTEYAIPKAIIKLKQGFGRLIRTKNDTGLVILLDDRINNKWGEVFYGAFPADINIKKGTKNQFLDILKKKS
ncbi:MAG: helicase C-terminal domain-containing protein [Candidatus Gracilibacteria bacterium]|nr:helicase C-terminal domain-containing protein [Candidatus Gracilibacteria bacterium]